MMLINKEEIFLVDYLKDASKSLVYAPLRGVLLLTEKGPSEKLFSEKGSKEKEVILKHIKKSPLINIKKVAKNLSSVAPSLSVSLSNRCNMSCIYCHANAGNKKTIKLTYSKIDFILNHYFKILVKIPKNKRTANISFLGGGEPTVEKKLLFYSVYKAKELAKNKNIPIYIGSATNGCFDKETANFILAEFNYISLSFDGPKFIHDFQRPFVNGLGTFEKVVETANFFKENNFNMAFRVTVSKIGLDNYKKLIDYFSQNFPEINIGIEPLYPIGKGKELAIAPTELEFTEGYKKIIIYSQNKNIRIQEKDIIQSTSLRPFYCTSVAVPNINVSPDGNIWACARESNPDLFNYGRFHFKENRVKINQEKVKKIKSLNVFNIPECQDCICKYHCGGDCPENRSSGNVVKCDSVKNALSVLLNGYYNLKTTNN